MHRTTHPLLLPQSSASPEDPALGMADWAHLLPDPSTPTVPGGLTFSKVTMLLFPAAQEDHIKHRLICPVLLLNVCMYAFMGERQRAIFLGRF